MKNRERIRLNTSKRRQLFPEKRKIKKSKTEGEDEHYGLAEPLIEFFSSEEMENKKSKFLEKLGRADVKKIEFETRDQSNSEMWYNERKIRLTASKFGQICKMRSNTSCKNVVHNILYASDTLQTKSVQYGREMETKARQKFEQLSKEKVYENGLIIDPEFPFLAASPGNSTLLLFYYQNIKLYKL